ncbi:hypothetical protein CEXT_238311 [Caerostris extrusa]|uniref:Uncharacterized protein n=1 Tax=Caerostris extrusa TaxID=172846 RepID=A0AAV4T324_CAEEX|nr:hypothetical protein CEXT_238311 [Caerostris extrusa]
MFYFTFIPPTSHHTQDYVVRYQVQKTLGLHLSVIYLSQSQIRHWLSSWCHCCAALAQKIEIPHPRRGLRHYDPTARDFFDCLEHHCRKDLFSWTCHSQEIS